MHIVIIAAKYSLYKKTYTSDFRSLFRAFVFFKTQETN